MGFIGPLANEVRAEHWARAYRLRPWPVPALITREMPAYFITAVSSLITLISGKPKNCARKRFTWRCDWWAWSNGQPLESVGCWWGWLRTCASTLPHPGIRCWPSRASGPPGSSSDHLRGLLGEPARGSGWSRTYSHLKYFPHCFIKVVKFFPF